MLLWQYRVLILHGNKAHFNVFLQQWTLHVWRWGQKLRVCLIQWRTILLLSTLIDLHALNLCDLMFAYGLMRLFWKSDKPLVPPEPACIQMQCKEKLLTKAVFVSVCVWVISSTLCPCYVCLCNSLILAQGKYSPSFTLRQTSILTCYVNAVYVILGVHVAFIVSHLSSKMQF